MYQNGTVTQDQVTRISLKYIAAIGAAMVITLVTSMIVVQAGAADDQPPSNASRLVGSSGADLGRHMTTSNEINDCTAGYDGTPSCAVSHG
jgi:hypothetical protein